MQKLTGKKDLVYAYRKIFSMANWEFAKNREKELSERLDGLVIKTPDGVLKTRSSYYEIDVINWLKRSLCRKRTERETKNCISNFIRKHRIPDLDLLITGTLGGDRVFKLTFVEIGTSDRYYYKRPVLIKNSPAGIVLDVLNGKRPGKVEPVEGNLVFDGETAREYVRVMSEAKRLRVDAFKPRKSTMPRIEYEKLKHFLKPIRDLKRRVAGGVPVYFGYYFSDDVALFMSFPEIKRLGLVKQEAVVSFGDKTVSKNILIEARNLKPLEILVLERLFNVVINVSDTDGEATVDGRHNSYKVNWVGALDWKKGSIKRVVMVNARPRNYDELYLLVKGTVKKLGRGQRSMSGRSS